MKGIRMKEHSPRDRQEPILRSLLNKYQADPEGFQSYLPNVAQELEREFPFRRGNSRPAALTEQERERLRQAMLQLVDKKEPSLEEAIQTLEYCATLIQDGSLPLEATRQILLSLLRQVIGAPLGKVGKATKFPLRAGEAVKEVAILCGVHLHLTWNDRLVAISISPTKLKERSKALKFVGIAQDAASDVAERHDTYLAENVFDATA